MQISVINSNEYSRTKLFLNYLEISATFILSFILLFAGATKIVDPSPLVFTLASTFNFLNESIIIFIASILPILEIGIGILLIFSLFHEKIRQKRKTILLTTALLFALFFAFSVYGFMINLQNDCGCFGNTIYSKIGFGMVLRNFILTSIAFLLFIVNRN